MKRSDMLNEITFILDEFVGDLDHPSISVRILDMLESHNMKLTEYFPHEGYSEAPWDEEDE